MITQPIEDFDFFSQLSLFAQCISDAGKLQMRYMQGVDTVEEEHALFERSATIQKKLILQKQMGLFPEEKRRFCILLSALSFRCQHRLLGIPRLCRLYASDLISAHLSPLAERTAILTECFTFFCRSKDTEPLFSVASAEEIFKVCIEGIRECRGILVKIKSEPLSVVEKLLFKDLVEEYLDLYSLSIQFLHCGLLFPL